MYIWRMKKNTLLYLDDNLVAKAKQYHLNMSQITENAVRSHLFPLLSYGEKAEADFWEYLKNLEKEKVCFFLPSRLKKVKLTATGPIRQLTLTFTNNNLVIGNSASGKTTLLRAIAYVFGHDPLDEYSFAKGRIELETIPEPSYKMDLKPEDAKSRVKCILLDCVGARLDKEHYQKFIKYLRSLDIQIIMTEYSQRENINYGKIKVMEL